MPPTGRSCASKLFDLPVDKRPTHFRFEPIIGVLFTALEAAGGSVNDTLLEKLIPTIPSSTLFTTAIDYSS